MLDFRQLRATFMVEKVALGHMLSLVSVITTLLHTLISFTDLPFSPTPWCNNTSGPGPPHYKGLKITLRHTHPHTHTYTHTHTHTHTWSESSGRVARLTKRPLPDNAQQSQQTSIHAPGGIRTPNHSRRAAADPRLRPSPTTDAT
jgi:hypothetical protein